jgi:hypothetical protein
MAFTEFYVRSGGSNLNAGSTNADAAAFTATAGNWVQSTRVFTKTGAISGVSVGDFASVYADGAGAPTGYVSRVTAVTADTITLSSTALSGTAPTDGTGNRTVRVGGAWGGASTGDISHAFTFPAGAMVNAAGDPLRVNIRGGTTWNITSGITRSTNGPVWWMGYTTTAGDGGFANIDGGTSTIILLTVSGAGVGFAWLEFSNNGTTGSNSLVGGTARSLYYRCRFRDARGAGINNANNAIAVECEAYLCNKSNTSDLGGLVCATALRCISHDHTSGATTNGNGFIVTFAAIDCIADRCNGAGFILFNAAVTSGCAAYNCINGAATNAATGPIIVVDNTVLGGNSTNGINVGSSNYVFLSNGVDFWSNTSGNQNSTAASVVFEGTASTALGSNPFTSVSTGARPTAGNFQVLSGLGQGAGAGGFLMSSSYYSSTSTGFPDVGAVQHQDAGGGTVVTRRSLRRLF